MCYLFILQDETDLIKMGCFVFYPQEKKKKSGIFCALSKIPIFFASLATTVGRKESGSKKGTGKGNNRITGVLSTKIFAVENF